jgi:hypothetical protein
MLLLRPVWEVGSWCADCLLVSESKHLSFYLPLPMLLGSDLCLIECSDSLFISLRCCSSGVWWRRHSSLVFWWWWCPPVVLWWRLSPELLPATTGAPAGAAGVSVAELLVPESTTICCTCLLRPRRQQNVSSRKVYLSLLMAPYFPWTALSMFA